MGTKVLNKTKQRSAEQAFMVAETARLTRKSTRQVYRVINGDSENEAVMRTYMYLAEGTNTLIKQAKELVPFNNH